MKEYQVTKYDPKNRDESGVYLHKDEWIYAGQLGETFKGKVFTVKEYLTAEARYIRAAKRFFRASGLSHLRATNVNMDDDDPFSGYLEGHVILHEEDLKGLTLCEDQKISMRDLESVVKLNLREFGGCRLQVEGKFFIHFGWDFYMYIGTTVDSQKEIEETECDGLFVETCPSPYKCPDEVTPIPKIEAYFKDGDKFKVDEIPDELLSLPLPQIRDLFGYSNEHPFTGYFPIDPATAERLQPFVGRRLDLDRYSYILSTVEPWF